MVYPVFSKTWQYNVNNLATAQGSAALDNSLLIFNIVGALLGFGSTPATVGYSCLTTGNVGTANDGVNRWSSSTALVWANAGNAHSWMVLKLPGWNGGGTGQVLFDLSNAATAHTLMSISVSSAAGFTGGTATAAPTATDQQFVLSNSNWSGVTTDLAIRWSVELSSDGQCIRFFAYAAGIQVAGQLIETLVNATTGFTNPNYAVYNTLFTTAGIGSGATGVSYINGTKATAFFTVEGLWNGAATNTALPIAQTVVNGISTNWPMFPLGMYTATAGVVGRMGTFQDLWVGSSSIPTGDTYIDSVNFRQWIQVGMLIFPWPFGQAINLS